jgi:hypothetical protein
MALAVLMSTALHTPCKDLDIKELKTLSKAYIELEDHETLVLGSNRKYEARLFYPVSSKRKDIVTVKNLRGSGKPVWSAMTNTKDTVAFELATFGEFADRFEGAVEIVFREQFGCFGPNDKCELTWINRETEFETGAHVPSGKIKWAPSLKSTFATKREVTLRGGEVSPRKLEVHLPTVVIMSWIMTTKEQSQKKRKL